jgi:hypothetical protein
MMRAVPAQAQVGSNAYGGACFGVYCDPRPPVGKRRIQNVYNRHATDERFAILWTARNSSGLSDPRRTFAETEAPAELIKHERGFGAYSARFHTSSAFPPDEVRATPKVKSSPASLMIDHF